MGSPTSQDEVREGIAVMIQGYPWMRHGATHFRQTSPSRNRTSTPATSTPKPSGQRQGRPGNRLRLRDRSRVEPGASPPKPQFPVDRRARPGGLRERTRKAPLEIARKRTLPGTAHQVEGTPVRGSRACPPEARRVRGRATNQRVPTQPRRSLDLDPRTRIRRPE